jgi:bacteriorhodopsin
MLSGLRPFFVLGIAVVILFVDACASGVRGRYENDNGAIAVEFKSGKAYVTMLAGTLEVDYQVKRDKVILSNHGGNVVLTRHEDGTLDGPMGTMKRK